MAAKSLSSSMATNGVGWYHNARTRTLSSIGVSWSSLNTQWIHLIIINMQSSSIVFYVHCWTQPNEWLQRATMRHMHESRMSRRCKIITHHYWDALWSLAPLAKHGRLMWVMSLKRWMGSTWSALRGNRDTWEHASDNRADKTIVPITQRFLQMDCLARNALIPWRRQSLPFHCNHAE